MVGQLDILISVMHFSYIFHTLPWEAC